MCIRDSLGTPESQETAMIVIATERGDIVIPCAQHEAVQCASLLFEQVEIHLCKAAVMGESNE